MLEETWIYQRKKGVENSSSSTAASEGDQSWTETAVGGGSGGGRLRSLQAQQNAYQYVFL